MGRLLALCRGALARLVAQGAAALLPLLRLQRGARRFLITVVISTAAQAGHLATAAREVRQMPQMFRIGSQAKAGLVAVPRSVRLLAGSVAPVIKAEAEAEAGPRCQPEQQARAATAELGIV